MPIYREDLEAPAAGQYAPGGLPGRDVVSAEDDMWFHPNCHLDSPTWARYRGDVLTIQCARCERDIVSLVIASREHDALP